MPSLLVRHVHGTLSTSTAEHDGPTDLQILKALRRAWNWRTAKLAGLAFERSFTRSKPSKPSKPSKNLRRIAIHVVIKHCDFCSSDMLVHALKVCQVINFASLKFSSSYAQQQLGRALNYALARHIADFKDDQHDQHDPHILALVGSTFSGFWQCCDLSDASIHTVLKSVLDNLTTQSSFQDNMRFANLLAHTFESDDQPMYFLNQSAHNELVSNFVAGSDKLNVVANLATQSNDLIEQGVCEKIVLNVVFSNSGRLLLQQLPELVQNLVDAKRACSNLDGCWDVCWDAFYRLSKLFGARFFDAFFASKGADVAAQDIQRDSPLPSLVLFIKHQSNADLAHQGWEPLGGALCWYVAQDLHSEMLTQVFIRFLTHNQAVRQRFVDSNGMFFLAKSLTRKHNTLGNILASLWIQDNVTSHKQE